MAGQRRHVCQTLLNQCSIAVGIIVVYLCAVGLSSERSRQRSVQTEHHQLLGSDERQSDAEHHLVEA